MAKLCLFTVLTLLSEAGDVKNIIITVVIRALYTNIIRMIQFIGLECGINLFLSLDKTR